MAPATLAAFPGTEEGQELRALVEAHGVALAAYELTARDGGRSKKVVADAQRAEAWLDDVRSGLERGGAGLDDVMTKEPALGLFAEHLLGGQHPVEILVIEVKGKALGLFVGQHRPDHPIGMLGAQAAGQDPRAVEIAVGETGKGVDGHDVPSCAEKLIWDRL